MVVGEPSPKFHKYTGEPEVVFTNVAESGPQLESVGVLKFTTGPGETVTVIVVSSTQCAVMIESNTLYVPAEV